MSRLPSLRIFFYFVWINNIRGGAKYIKIFCNHRFLLQLKLGKVKNGELISWEWGHYEILANKIVCEIELRHLLESFLRKKSLVKLSRGIIVLWVTQCLIEILPSPHQKWNKSFILFFILETSKSMQFFTTTFFLQFTITQFVQSRTVGNLETWKHLHKNKQIATVMKPF